MSEITYSLNKINFTIMKNIIYTTVLSIILCFSLNAQQKSENFYYYKGEKIYLQQRTDKIHVKFAPNANRNQIRSQIGNDSLSSAAIKLYKENPEVVSANFMLEYNGVLQGLTDEFVVKLKETTSYRQLEELALKNYCIIGEENEFVKNQFMMHVPKISHLNAMQMSNLFYETELFDYSAPNFVVVNAFLSNDPYFKDQWGLKNTGQYGGISGMDINVEQIN